MEKIQVFDISTPEYNFNNGKPDFEAISDKIVQCLRKQFLGKRIAFRLLGSEEHPEKSVEDLINIIKKLGHDRYDPNRIGDRYDNLDNVKIDFFALEFEVGNKDEEECVKWALDSFYEWPLNDRGSPVRVDIGIVYDLSQLQIVEHRYLGREDEIKRDGFVFKNQDEKPNAILGIIKIF